MCSTESHATDKSRRAPTLQFRAFQYDADGVAMIAYVHCRLCNSTLACLPEEYAAFVPYRPEAEEVAA